VLPYGGFVMTTDATVPSLENATVACPGPVTPSFFLQLTRMPLTRSRADLAAARSKVLGLDSAGGVAVGAVGGMDGAAFVKGRPVVEGATDGPAELSTRGVGSVVRTGGVSDGRAVDGASAAAAVAMAAGSRSTGGGGGASLVFVADGASRGADEFADVVERPSTA
jgi:hypothetical protein